MKEFGENIWTKRFVKELMEDKESKVLMIPDCICVEEFEYIVKKMKGRVLTVLVKRYGVTKLEHHYDDKRFKIDCTYEIENNGTMEELKEKVDILKNYLLEEGFI